jgi:hypothetical protein
MSLELSHRQLGQVTGTQWSGPGMPLQSRRDVSWEASCPREGTEPSRDYLSAPAGQKAEAHAVRVQESVFATPAIVVHGCVSSLLL